MEDGIPEIENESSAMGDKLHHAMETDSEDDLDIHEIDKIEYCRSVKEEVISRFGEPDEIINEVQVKTVVDGVTITSGWVDQIYLYIKQKHAVYFDWKFGYKPVKNAAKNIQVVSYGLSIHKEFGVDEATAYVVRAPIKFASSYTFRKFYAIQEKLETIRYLNIECAKQKTPILKPTEYGCLYCKAKMFCPAYREFMEDKHDELGTELEQATGRPPDSLLVKLLDTYYTEKPFWKDVRVLAKIRIKEYVSHNQLMGDYGLQKSRAAKSYCESSVLRVLLDLIPTAEINDFKKLMLGKVKDTWVKRYRQENECTIKEAKIVYEGLTDQYITYETSESIKKY
jgi:hypothetical protein